MPNHRVSFEHDLSDIPYSDSCVEAATQLYRSGRGGTAFCAQPAPAEPGDLTYSQDGKAFFRDRRNFVKER